MKIVTALIPPAEVQNISAKISSVLGEFFPAHFVLDEESFFSHVTLFTAEFDAEDIEEIHERVREISSLTEPIDLVVGNMYEGWGYVMVNLNTSHRLLQLHSEVANELATLRTNTEITNDKLFGKHREYAEKYGTPRVLDLYTPHLTLSRLQNIDDAKKAISQLSFPITEFQSREVGLFVGGEHGTCTDLLAKYELSA